MISIETLIFVVAVSFVGMYLLNRLHPALSMQNFASSDAYLDHKIKRDYYLREEQLGWAAFNVVVSVVALASCFSKLILPTIALVAGTSLSWCLYRVLCPRPEQLFVWDAVDICVLALALAVGIAAAVTMAILLVIPVALVVWLVFLYGIAWAMIMPV